MAKSSCGWSSVGQHHKIGGKNTHTHTHTRVPSLSLQWVSKRKKVTKFQQRIINDGMPLVTFAHPTKEVINNLLKDWLAIDI
jgi:hypothetical protein